MALKDYFTGDLRDKLKYTVTYLKYCCLKIISSNIFTIKIYYLFTREYNLEMKHIMGGKVSYYGNIIDDKNIYVLRRNIHRIEKGMVMKPRRSVFATGFIGETVLAFKKLWESSDINERNNPLINWSIDVLEEYFTITGNHPSIEYAEKIFRQMGFYSNEDINKEVLSIPYKRNTLHNSNINFEDFYQLCKVRRSVRWYLDKKVPREVLDKAFNAALLSPSACNRQPFEFRVFDSNEKINLISKIPGGTLGFSHNFPGIIVIIGNFDAVPFEADRHVPYIDASLAAMSLMLSLESLGLSTCPINWRDDREREKKVREILKLDKTQRPIMFLSYGYADPDGMIPFSQKKMLNEIRFYN